MFPRKLGLQIPIFHSIFCQRSSLSIVSHNVPPQKSTIKPKLIKQKDWLSKEEAVMIFENLEDPKLAHEVFDELSERKDYKPSQELYLAAIKKLALAKNFDFINTLMERIKLERKFELSDEFFHDVIKVYGYLGGRINSAIYTLYDMPSYKCQPSVKTFNLVLNLLVRTKQFEVIHEVVAKATDLCVSIDACCLNIVIKGLCHCGKFDAAFAVLDEFDKLNIRPNKLTFSTIMDGLITHGRVDEALGVFDRMLEEEVDPDAVTFNILIKGLRKKGKFQEGVDIMTRMLRSGSRPNVGTYQQVLLCLLDAKKFVEAKEFVGKMNRGNVKLSVEACQIMLDEFCKNKDVENVDWVLKEMVGHNFKLKIGMWKQAVECVVSVRAIKQKGRGRLSHHLNGANHR